MLRQRARVYRRFACLYACSWADHAKHGLRAGTSTCPIIAGRDELTDIPHHLHYDLKLYDRDGHESTATYDIYRDPTRFKRIEIKAGDYQFTRISSCMTMWTGGTYTGDVPLKLVDFERVLDYPEAAANRFSKEPQSVKQMQPQQLQGAPCSARMTTPAQRSVLIR